MNIALHATYFRDISKFIIWSPKSDYEIGASASSTSFKIILLFIAAFIRTISKAARSVCTV